MHALCLQEDVQQLMCARGFANGPDSVSGEVPTLPHATAVLFGAAG